MRTFERTKLLTFGEARHRGDEVVGSEYKIEHVKVDMVRRYYVFYFDRSDLG